MNRKTVPTHCLHRALVSFFLFLFCFFYCCSISLTTFSVSFADYPRNIRETILKERIASARDKRLEARKRRRMDVRVRATNPKMYFRYKFGADAGRESSLCLHSFRNLFGLGRTMWRRLNTEALRLAPGPSNHGNVGLRNRHVGSGIADLEPDIVAFLNLLGQDHGESYATRYIQERSSLGLHNEEEGSIDLPSHFTKRKIFERYVFFIFIFLL